LLQAPQEQDAFVRYRGVVQPELLQLRQSAEIPQPSVGNLRAAEVQFFESITTVQQRADQPDFAGQQGQNRLDLLRGKYHGQPLGLLGPHRPHDLAQLDLQHFV